MPTKFSKQLGSILSGYKNVNIAAGNNTIRVVYSATLSEQKTFDFYDEFITEAELQKTFNEYVIIVHDEVILSKIILRLHEWLLGKCCDQSKIILLSTHTFNAGQWWEDYKAVMNIDSYTIIDVPFNQYNINYHLNKFNKTKNDKKIEKCFSWLGGTRDYREDTDYISVLLSKYKKIGVVDKVGKVTSKQKILNFAETITNFSNAIHVNEIESLYDLNVTNEYLTVLDGDYTRTYACAIRETRVIEPFYVVTEKTLKSILYENLLLTPQNMTVMNDALNKVGFKTFIECNHKTKSFKEDVDVMCGYIEEYADKSIDELYSLYDTNKHDHEYNYDYVMSGKCFKNIKYMVEQQLDARIVNG
tara:strand:+ start:126 stop:1205 length:1080 start_codon:yes stop_codon:yes gene_type:complete